MHHDPLQDEGDDGHRETHEPSLDAAQALGTRHLPCAGAAAHTPTRSASGVAGAPGAAGGAVASGCGPETVVPAPRAFPGSKAPPPPPPPVAGTPRPPPGPPTAGATT